MSNTGALGLTCSEADSWSGGVECGSLALMGSATSAPRVIGSLLRTAVVDFRFALAALGLALLVTGGVYGSFAANLERSRSVIRPLPSLRTLEVGVARWFSFTPQLVRMPNRSYERLSRSESRNSLAKGAV